MNATDTSLDYKSMLLTLLNLPDSASDDDIQSAYDSETEEASGGDNEGGADAAAETSPGAEGGSTEGSANDTPPAAKKFRGSAMQIIIRGHNK